MRLYFCLSDILIVHVGLKKREEKKTLDRKENYANLTFTAVVTLFQCSGPFRL